MKRFLPLLSAVVVLSLGSSASAVLLRGEPFNYTAGDEIVSHFETWLQAGAAYPDHIAVASGNLAMPAELPAGVGNSASITGVGAGSGTSVRLGLGQTTTADTVYFSFPLRIDSLEGSNSTIGGFFIGLNNSTGSQTSNPTAAAARVQVRIDPSDAMKYDLGVFRNVGATAAALSWGGPLTVGDTHFIVASYEIVDGTQNDVARLWIDPAPDTFGGLSPPPASIADNTTGTGIDINIASIILRQSPAPFLTLDELRVGTTWLDVTRAFNVYTWEYVSPSDPSQGKRESTVVTPGGTGVHAQPGLNASRKNLTMAYLIGADLNDANLTRANLSQADLTAADLTGANLTGANLADAVLTDAVVKNAKLSSTHITLDQLYSTASYVNHDLTGVHFVGNDLSGANLAGQQLASASFYAAKLVGTDLTNANLNNAELVNADLSQANLTNANLTNATLALANLSQANLRNANFTGANLTSTNLTGADVRGARLGGAITYVYGSVCGRPSVGGCLYYHYGVVGTQIGGGINLAQLSTTASYQAHDLSVIDLSNTNLAGANFDGFNLTNAKFSGATLTGADVSGADARGTSDLNLAGAVVTNLIRPDGHVDGLDLGAGQSLSIRDYDGSVATPIIPITVDQHFAMGAGGTLRMVFEADAWDSTISFAAGTPVMLGGSLELALAAGLDPNSQIGRTFDLFDWTGVSPTGMFAVSSPYVWNLSKLYTTGEVTFLAASGSGGSAPTSLSIPEPTTYILLSVGLVAASMIRRRRPAHILLPLFALLVLPCSRSLADVPNIQLTKIANPSWKPVDFQLFSAPATPFDQEFGHVYNTVLPDDTAATYVPHAPPYDTELTAGALAGGYVSQSVFTPDQITLNPNGVYFVFMLVPDPGITGSSRDFTSGPVIANSLFPIAINIDAWLDGVLVDRLPGVDAIIPVQPKDAAFQGTSHLESIQAIWHPWDDDLTVGPLGNYDLRLSVRDVGGSGWDVLTQFRVAIPGDYSGNGTVGPEDYNVWKANFGSTTLLAADGNGNHIVDAADYTVWRDNFGNSLGSGSGAALPSAAPLSAGVPEPATIGLLIVGVLWMVSLRRAEVS